MAVDDQVLWASLALLPIVSFTSCSWSSAQDTTNTSTTTTGVTFPLPSNCPTRCGNITFHYPFGIGHGCFRPGFDLTCSTATDPPKLFLANGSEAVIEVISDIDPQWRTIAIKAPVAVMGVKDNSNIISWTPQANSPYTSSPFSNSLWVIGCNATASLVDLTHNVTVATCVTTCPAAGGPDPGYNVTQQTCKGIGCCYVNLHTEIKSYSIKLYRLNQATKSNASSVKALVASIYGPTNNYYSSGDELMTVPVAYLWWKINDGLSCNEANETNSYACLSQYSECSNSTDYYSISDNSRNVGYYCSCLTSQGNPYVPNGCYDSNSTALPGTNCATKLCGNISVPFPFGFEEGCFKDTWFALTCNETSNPPILLFNLSYNFNSRVINITVDDGQMEVTAVTDDNNVFTGSTKPFGFLQERVIFEWVVDYKTCELAKQNTSDYACRSIHSTCFNRNVTTDYRTVRAGYFCKCWDGFPGNPYLPDGCKAPSKCKLRICSKLVLGVVIGVSIGMLLLILTALTIFGIRKWKILKEKRIKEKHFHENHGLLLQQLISSNEDIADRTRLFPLEEIEKATNNFDSTRIVGRGGHGTVYKGILADQRIVAIKKSKIVLKNEIDQFINEVAILSRINHRNIVRLFGCCLETEVPLLVYEFVSNGTLHDHLYLRDANTRLSWNDRLRIAREAAAALSYLHSAAFISIFHRDVKSSNILLDDQLTAKVSDFGSSRSMPNDETHIVTVVQGTYGYLDPQYYRTCELTEKSDVYSFGVILLELLTGKKPISPDIIGEERNLTINFLRAIDENRHFELLDARVQMEGKKEDLEDVIQLACMCISFERSARPTMKEVEYRLQVLIRKTKQSQEPLILVPSNSSHGAFLASSSNQSNEDASSQCYSMEKYLLSSLDFPR